MSAKTSKLVGFLSFVLIFVGCVVAGLDAETGSRSNRGQALEGAWYGLRAVFGLEGAEPGLLWGGRALVLAGAVLLVFWIVKKLHRSRPANPTMGFPYQPGR